MNQSKIGWRTLKRRGLKVCKKNLQKLLPCCSMVKKKADFCNVKPQLSIYGSVHHEKRKTSGLVRFARKKLSNKKYTCVAGHESYAHIF